MHWIVIEYICINYNFLYIFLQVLQIEDELEE